MAPRNVHIILLMAVFCFCLNCKNDPVGTTPPRQDYDLYLAGSIENRGCYWLNGTLNVMQDSDEKIESVFVVNSDIYLAGSSGNKACYWKNGVKMLLTGKSLSKATSIFVVNDTVYVAGFDRDHINEPVSACYWVNGIQTYLSSIFSKATSIYCHNSTIYVGGEEDWKACFWKNGVKTQLSNFTSTVKSIYVDANNLFIGGYDSRTVSDYGVEIGWYWHNGQKHDLFYDDSGNLELSGDLNDLFVHNSDVYAVGRDNWTFVPIYWKNGTKTEIPAPDSYSTRATSIFVMNEDIFIGGYYFDRITNVNTACYWRNGVRTDLPGQNAKVYSMFLQPQN